MLRKSKATYFFIFYFIFYIDDDDSYSIRHWTDVPPGEVSIVPFSSRGRLRAGPFLARDRDVLYLWPDLALFVISYLLRVAADFE